MMNTKTFETLTLNVISLNSPAFKKIKKAKIVFKHACDSVNQLYNIFQTIRSNSKGTTTHGEQDLLRAMLVFASSGLDSVLKQLIKESLALVINGNEGAELEFIKYVERKFRKQSIQDDRDKGLSFDFQFLAQTLVSRSPRDCLISMLQEELAETSLQSQDQLLKVASNFAITRVEILKKDDNSIKAAFNVRNEIIHEMDAHLDGHKKRKQRKEKEMVQHCESILNVAACFINTVEQKIK